MTELATQYGARAAAGFSNQAAMPVREYAESHTLLHLLGRAEGLNILDLACGAGFYTRAVAQAGARRVVGVDASGDMITQARANTPAELPIEYKVADASALASLGQFDAVTAGFMLNYARTVEQLSAMCSTVASQLKPGGRFVGTIPNSAYDPDKVDSRYGISLDWPTRMKDGDEYQFKLYLMDPPLTLRCHYWKNRTYQVALEKAGLKDIEFPSWQISPLGIERLGVDFWQNWLNNPLYVFITARRA